MNINIDRLGDILEDAGLFTPNQQNQIYDFRINSRSYKIMSLAMHKLKRGHYVQLKDLKAYIHSHLPEVSDKQITSTLYKTKNVVRHDGLWRKL